MLKNASVCIITILIFVCSISVSAAEIETAGPGITEMFSEAGYSYFDKVRSLTDSEINEYILQFEQEDKQTEKEGLEKYREIKPLLGTFESYREAAVYQTEKKNYVISVIGGFENGECVMTLTLMSDLQTIGGVDFLFVEKEKNSSLTAAAGLLAAGLLAAVCAAVLALSIRRGRGKHATEEEKSSGSGDGTAETCVDRAWEEE